MSASKTAEAAAMADLQVQNEGSIFLFHPLTEAGTAFVNEVIENSEDGQVFGRALVVERRYVLGIIDAARESGLTFAQ